MLNLLTMLLRNFVFVLILVIIEVSVVFGRTSLKLEDVYRFALKKSESVVIQEQKIEEASEAHWQTRASIFPTLSASGSYLTRASISNQRSFKLTLEQPLFQGLSELYAPKVTAAQLRSKEWELVQKKEDLYKEVAFAFYALLNKRKEKEHLSEQQDLIAQRVRELKKREKIGRSRKSEVLSAESRASLLDVEMARNAIDLIEAEKNFEYYTGLSGQIILEDPGFLIPNILPWVVVEKSIRDITSLKILREDLSAADYTVSAAYSGHLPSVNLTTSYYLQRTGIYADTKWDFSINLKIPIFQGGIVQSRVRESASQREQAQLELSQKEREEYKTVQILYDQAKIYLKLLRSYQDAVSVSEKNYIIQKKEYRFGLVTNLEVFEALNTSIETKRKRDQALYQLKLALAKLQVVTGKVPL